MNSDAVFFINLMGKFFGALVVLVALVQYPLHLYSTIALRLSNESLLEGDSENSWGFGQVSALVLVANTLIQCGTAYHKVVSGGSRKRGVVKWRDPSPLKSKKKREKVRLSQDRMSQLKREDGNVLWSRKMMLFGRWIEAAHLSTRSGQRGSLSTHDRPLKRTMEEIDRRVREAGPGHLSPAAVLSQIIDGMHDECNTCSIQTIRAPSPATVQVVGANHDTFKTSADCFFTSGTLPTGRVSPGSKCQVNIPVRIH